MNSSYFLGANSKDGFYSLYHELIDLKQANRLYIIKGGSGSGKSTFMKSLANRLKDKSRIEYIHCSADPDSLDAVVLCDLGCAIVDGTAPHAWVRKHSSLKLRV